MIVVTSSPRIASETREGIQGVYNTLGLPVSFDDSDIVFTYREDDKYVASITLNLSVGFPYSSFDKEIEELRNTHTIGYMSKFSSVRHLKRRELREMLSHMFFYGGSIGVTLFLAACTKEHASVYEKLFNSFYITEGREIVGKEYFLIGKRNGV